jgi:hypothetical protein
VVLPNLILSPVFFLLGLHGFVGVHRNQSYKDKEITNMACTKTKTTISTVVGVFLQLHHPQQQPQQQWQQQQETTPTTIPAVSATTDKDSKTNKNPQQT